MTTSRRSFLGQLGLLGVAAAKGSEHLVPALKSLFDGAREKVQLMFPTDATYDIGASGSGRFRDSYLSRNYSGPTLEVLSTPTLRDVTLTYSCDKGVVSVAHDGNRHYPVDGKGTITIKRPPFGSEGSTVAFKASDKGQVTATTLYIPPVDA